MTKAFIFDLDGTLLNTLPTIAYYCNKTLDTLNLPHVTDEECVHMVGHGIGMLIEQLLSKYNCTDEKIVHDTLSYYRKIYDDGAIYLTEPYTGICDLVDELKAQGHRLAVLSNKPDFTVNLLINHFFSDKFEIIYGARNDIPKKPDPTVLYEILNSLGVLKEDCYYIGDSDVDMQTGKNAGIFTVGVDWGFRGREELEQNGADLIVESTNEILDLVK